MADTPVDGNGFYFCSSSSASVKRLPAESQNLTPSAAPAIDQGSPNDGATKTENRGRFIPNLIPTTWTKIVESKLFAPKHNKEPLAQEDAQVAPTPTAESGPTVPKHHRRSKSEPIAMPDQSDALEAEMLKLALRHTTAGKTPIQAGAQRTVGGVVEASPDLAQYAHSVEGELMCMEPHTPSPAKSGKNKDEEDVTRNSVQQEKSKGAIRGDHWSTITQPRSSKHVKPAEQAPDLTPAEACGTLVDEAVNSNMWGLTASDLVKPDLAAQSAQVPNCTASQGQKHWRITDSTLKAYTSMRGSYRLAGRDLFVWMDRCDKSFGKPAECDEKVGSPGSLIDVLEPLHTGSPAPLEEISKKEVFVVPRPPYGHITPPANFEAGDHQEPVIEIPADMVEALTCDNTYVGGDDGEDGFLDLPKRCLSLPEFKDDHYAEDAEEFVISDDEGDPLDGRISPCTFRLWAEGCQRADVVNIRAPAAPAGANESEMADASEAKSESRCPSEVYPMLGTGPGNLYWNPDGISLFYGVARWQNTVNNRSGATAVGSNQHNHEGPIDRNPKAFTHEEVQSALQADDAQPLAGIAPQDVEAVLKQRYDALQACQMTEQQTSNLIQAAEARIAWRRAQLERVSTSVQAVLEKQEQEKRAQEQERRAHEEKRRRDDIYRHVAQHLEEVEQQCQAKQQTNYALHVKLNGMLAQESEMVRAMAEQARRVGVGAGGDVPRDLEAALQALLDDNGAPDEAQGEDDFDDSRCFF